MNEELRKRIKKMNLLPIELDEELQEYFKEQNIDPSTAETHYSPGTPPHVTERYDRIRENALKLHEMDLEGKSDSEEYRHIEEQIDKDLFECTFPTTEDVLHKMMQRGEAYTGVAGAVRDTIITISGNKEKHD